MPPFATLSARLGGWPRRIAAIGCLLLAASSAVAARPVAASAERGRDVVVAAHDLPAGAVLAPNDVRAVPWPAAIRPSAASERPGEVTGHRLGGALRAGEPITTTRLANGDLTVGLRPGLVAVPVELTSVSNVAILRPGDIVDLLGGDHVMATDSLPGGRAEVLAEAVRVLAVSPAPERDNGTGSSIVVAVDRAGALRLAASTGRVILATLRGPP